jgi:anti-anti-sigma factor
MATFVSQSLDDSESIQVSGEIDVANAAEFEESVLRASRVGKPVRIDLTRCTYIDSNAVNVLVKLHETPELRLVATSGSVVQRVFDIVGISEHFPITYEATKLV